MLLFTVIIAAVVVLVTLFTLVLLLFVLLRVLKFIVQLSRGVVAAVAVNC